MLKYAENIKSIRKNKNITQTELAEGIASQGMISKIEKKQLSPDIDLLEEIAIKLDCSLMDLLLGENEDGLAQVYTYIEDLIKKREYNLLQSYYNTEPLIQTIKIENEGYHRWIRGILFAEVENNPNEGIDQMVKALDLIEDEQLTIRVLVGLSVIYSEVKQFDHSLENLLTASKLSKNVKIDIKLQQSINFQIARLYSVMEDFDDSIFYTRIAIEQSINEDSLYLLDDLYLLLADSYLRTNRIDKAKVNIELSNTIAEIRRNSKLSPYIERTQSKIEHTIKKNDI